MAIPFNVEDNSDYQDVVLQRLISDLCQTLQQISEIHRRRAQNLTTNRTHSSVSTNGRRAREPGQPQDLTETLLNSVVNLALSPAGTQNEVETFLQPQSSSLPVRRLHRRRSQSEPPFCEEVKPVKVSVSVEVTNKDWIQQEQPPESSTTKKCCRSENLFSKLVPAPFNGPLWTAVVCVVGWHLLRTR